MDKGDRATSEQVLDNRTRLILFKMQQKGMFSEINGCVSTGKEVYPPSLHLFSSFSCVLTLTRPMSTTQQMHKEKSLQ